MKRRLIALVLTITTLLTPLSGCATNKPSVNSAESSVAESSSPTVAQNDYLTRGEWLILLGAAFGMKDFTQQSGYFSDVTNQDELFAYVQSCYEWGALKGTQDGKLHPNAPADKGFVAATAIRLVDIFSFANSSDEDLFRYARENGIIYAASDGKEGMAEKLLLGEAQGAIAVAKDILLHAYGDITPEEDTALVESVTDLRANPEAFLSIEDMTIKMPSEAAAGLAAGSVLITAPTPEEPTGIARKVVSLHTANGITTLETVEPALDEVFTELSISGTYTPEVVDFIPAEGVTISGGGTSGLSVPANQTAAIINNLAVKPNASLQMQQTKGISMGFTINITKGTLKTTTDFDYGLSLVAAQGDDKMKTLYEKTGVGWVEEDGSKKLYTKDKYTGGYEITGSLQLKDMYVTVEYNPKKVWGVAVPGTIQSMVTEVHYEVESSLSVKGAMKEKVSVGKVPIVTGGVYTIWCEIFVEAAANGELTITAVCSNTVVTVTQNGKTTKTSNAQASTDAKVQIKATLSFGGSITVKACGIKLVNVDAKVGVGVNASAKGTLLPAGISIDGILLTEPTTYICFDISFYFPTVSISLGTDSGTLASKLGIKFTANIMDIKGGLLKSEIVESHYEMDRSWVDPADCILNHIDELSIEDVIGDDSSSSAPSSTTDSSQSAPSSSNPYARLVIEKVLITLQVGETSQIIVTSFPDGEGLGDVIFESHNTAVVTVDKTGVLVAVGAGTTQIEVTTPSGGKQVCAVTVLESSSANSTGVFL